MAKSSYSMPSEVKKDSIKERELYTLNSDIDPSIFDEENIEIDPYSLKLLEEGEVNQRYAVIGYVDTINNKLYLYFRPSFEELPNQIEEEKEARLHRLFPGIAKFKKEDTVGALAGTPGVVHVATIESVYKRNKTLNNTLDKDGNPLRTSSLPEVESQIRIGLSFYKQSEYDLDWLSRSTLNQYVFTLDPLARICFYFDSKQSSFERPEYVEAFHLYRTLEPSSFEKLINAVRKKLLKNQGIEQGSIKNSLRECLDRKWLSDSEKIRENNHREAFEEWKRIRNDKEELARRIMRTVYFAAGMKECKQLYIPQISNRVLIAEALEVAKYNNIELNLNTIPSSFVDQASGRTALMQAVLAKDLGSVKALLSYNNETIDFLMRKDSNNKSALDLAMSTHQNEIVREIYSYLIKTKEGLCAFIQSAIQQNNIAIIYEILKKSNIEYINFDINENLDELTIEKKVELFHLAARNGQLEVMKLLIENGIDVNIKNKETECTALHYACLHGSHECVEYLLGCKANVNEGDYTKTTTPLVFMMMSSQPNPKIVKSLMDAKADINAKNEYGVTAINCVIQNKNIKVLKMLLESKNELIIEKKVELFHLAARNGQLKVMKLLIEDGIDVNIKNKLENECTALHYACLHGSHKCVEYLLGCKANVNEGNCSKTTPLVFMMSSQPNPEIVKSLMDAKADINAENEYGERAINCAIQNKNIEVLKMLLESKEVKVGERDRYGKYGYTPYHLAIENGDVELITQLHEQGADINAKDWAGQNVLAFAVVKKKKIEIVKKLLEFKDLDLAHQRIGHYYTRSESRNDEILGLLDKRQFDFNMKDGNGCLPLHYVQDAKQVEILTRRIDNSFIRNFNFEKLKIKDEKSIIVLYFIKKLIELSGETSPLVEAHLKIIKSDLDWDDKLKKIKETVKSASSSSPVFFTGGYLSDFNRLMQNAYKDDFHPTGDLSM